MWLSIVYSLDRQLSPIALRGSRCGAKFRISEGCYEGSKVLNSQSDVDFWRDWPSSYMRNQLLSSLLILTFGRYPVRVRFPLRGAQKGWSIYSEAHVVVHLYLELLFWRLTLRPWMAIIREILAKSITAYSLLVCVFNWCIFWDTRCSEKIFYSFRMFIPWATQNLLWSRIAAKPLRGIIGVRSAGLRCENERVNDGYVKGERLKEDACTSPRP